MNPATAATPALVQAPAARRRPVLRNLVVFTFKAALASVLIGWLVRSQSLDFGALRILLQSPSLLAANLAVWCACSLLLSTARWRLLLRLAGVRIGLLRGTQLQLMALFFNVVVPGNVGGDVLKSLYVARDVPPDRRPGVLLVVLIERLMGLAGLALTGATLSVIRWPTLWSNPTTRPLVLAVALLASGALLGPLAVLAAVRRWGDALILRCSGTSRVRKLCAQVLASAQLAARRPGILVASLFISMAMHAIGIAWFTLLTKVILDANADWGIIASIFPIGVLSIVLPISPAGMGVGHVVFDQLYKVAHLAGGATVFNVYLIGQIVPCVVGAIPYLLLRSRSGTVPELASGPGDSSQ